MNLSDLLKSGQIRKVSPDEVQTQELLKVARRDIRVAKKLLSDEFDSAFAWAYNSMLQSARALMFSEGYMAVGAEHHKAVVEYADAKLGTKYADLMDVFDDMRRKRHKVMYEKAGVISEYEAKLAVKTAEEFLSRIEEKLKRV